jgi:UDP-N-acetylmuramoylalanine--D-glutamate ligase
MNQIIKNLKKQYGGKRVLVVGLGLQGGGVGVAKFFAELGTKVTVTDKKTKDQLVQSIELLKQYPIKYYLGDHPTDIFVNTDFIFKGPSIRWDMTGIIAAEQKEIPVEMEISFFAKHCPAKIIGVTGTRGKSTTTAMIYKMLKDNGINAYLGGNIPNVSTISLLNTVTEKDWVVLELASWLLSGFDRHKISPHIAVFTNLYPDHLNYYASMSHYVKDKKAIYLHQTSQDYLIANNWLKEQIEHDFVKSKIYYFSKSDFPYELEYIKGIHNQENAAAALKVAEILQLNKQKAIRAISSFKGAPCRQEIIGKKYDVIFVNDSTSTTPVATCIAIDTFLKDGKKLYLLLGGTSKNLPLEILIKRLKDVDKIILLKGSFTDEILPQLKKLYPKKITEIFSDLKMGVKKAYSLAKITGGYLLFSPGAPSFAMFNNEFHRGEEFNKIVRTILLNSKIKSQKSKLS